MSALAGGKRCDPIVGKGFPDFPPDARDYISPRVTSVLTGKTISIRAMDRVAIY